MKINSKINILSFAAGILIILLIKLIEWLAQNWWPAYSHGHGLPDLFGIFVIAVYIVGGAVVWKAVNYSTTESERPKSHIYAVLLFVFGSLIGASFFFTAN